MSYSRPGWSESPKNFHKVNTGSSFFLYDETTKIKDGVAWVLASGISFPVREDQVVLLACQSRFRGDNVP